MAEVLVLVEHSGGEVKKITNELLTAAARLGEPAAVVVGTPGTAGKLSDRLATYGAAKVYVAESDQVNQFLTAPAVGVLAELVAGPAGRGPHRRLAGWQGDRRQARGAHR